MCEEIMTKEEMINVLIEQYANLQRIKRAEKAENEELDYQIRVTKARLEAFGVLTENLDIN
ncbi:MAG: hypothetical protein E7266_06215 [Lachnospiraceae bacterium]|nr:hypothetical protein [Lachnospiraceae bacterium]